MTTVKNVGHGLLTGGTVASKKLFILANSIKKQHRCVAGREITKDAEGEEYWGGWVRPVTHHDEGAVYISECLLQDRSIPVQFDVIEIPVAGRENSSTQPENWFIRQGGQWTKVGAWGIKEAQQLVETPKDLWLEPGAKQDRVTAEYLLSRDDHQSLYLIEPSNFRIFIDISAWEGVEKKRARGIFHYNGHPYNFSMTDPLFSQKYFPDFGKLRSGYLDTKLGKDMLICVSLTPEFGGFHYKIVATVIEV